MIKKIVSLTAALAMLCSQIAHPCAVLAVEETSQYNYSRDFSSENDISDFSLYDSANTEGAIYYDSQNQRLSVSFGDNHSWNNKNGIKTDITELVKVCKNGDKVTVSLDFTSTWWGDPVTKAKVFLETVSGDTVDQVTLTEGPETVSENNERVTLLGETNEYTYAEGSTVYLCITQSSGMHYYDNISISVDADKEEDTPGSNELINDTFDDGAASGYAVYDSADTAAQLSVDTALSISFGNDWNENNGFRKDITSLAENQTIYEASADVDAYWGNDGTAAAKMFFEIVSKDNPKKQIAIGEASNAEKGTSDGTVTVSGSAKLEFNEGDTVYFCVTQNSGYHKYDNIKLKYSGTLAPEPTAAATPVTTSDNGELFRDDFASGNMTGYAVYDSTDTAAQLAVDGVLGISFGNDWSVNNGFRKDITEFVKTRGTAAKYEASADVYSSWWGETPAKLFFEVIGSNGTKKVEIDEAVPDTNSGSVPLGGTADLRFEDGDRIYLCVTQGAGYQTYDNIAMKYIGEADPEPAATIEPSTSPEATQIPLGEAIFFDDFSDQTQSGAYKLYNSSNTTQGAGISIDSGELAASMGAETWNDSNGIRRDITDYVRQYISGVTFVVQLDMTAYWGDTNDVSGNVFFEVTGNDGSVSTVDITEILPQNGSQKASVQALAQLSYKDGDKIDLCVTQKSGNHRYDNIAMYLADEGTEGVIPLTSGQRYAGKFFPESAKAIFKNTFGGNAAEMEKYSPYNSVVYTTAEPRDGGAFFQFPDEGAVTRGVKVDITDEIDANIPYGGDIRITCKMLPWYWWGSASVKVRVGNEITNIETYTAKEGDPKGKWVTIGDVINLKHTPGEKVEIIITMDSSSATGITIDDVCAELPYGDITARDVAVSDISKLDAVDTVSIVYGGEFITEADVTWERTSSASGAVYGKTSIDGVTARAVITDTAVKVTVTSNGITTDDIKLEYGRAITASGDNEMVFLLDSLDNMNLISSVSGTGVYASPAEGTTGMTVEMIISDNGDGITIEGTVPDAAYNDKIILIKDEGGSLVKAVYVRLDADGKYLASESGFKSGKYTAIMTDTGVSAEFSYATEDEFEELRSKMINASAISSLLEAESNRNILGAGTYNQLDKLSASAKMRAYNAFAANVANLTRAEAISEFDALVTIQSSEAGISEEEWTQMIEASSQEMGLKGTAIYEQYKNMTSSEKSEVKSKVAALNPSDIGGFGDIFSGAVLNTLLIHAGNYSKVQSILRENAGLFYGTGVDVQNIGVSAAQYVNKNITANDSTISSIAALVRSGNSDTTASIKTGLSGGGGGGGSGSLSRTVGSSNSGSVVSGTNTGLVNKSGQNSTDDPYTSSGNTEPDSIVFNDLGGYDWALDAIYSLADKGVINGYDDGTFRPSENITREAFVKIIVTALNIPSAQPEFEFSDVASDRWSHDFIAAAAAAGIVAGISDDEFAPEDDITRQDAVVIIHRALIYSGQSLKEGGLGFTDSEYIADYAKEAVAALSTEGVINGMDDGSFAPLAEATRAQAAIMIDKIVSVLI